MHSVDVVLSYGYETSDRHHRHDHTSSRYQRSISEPGETLTQKINRLFESMNNSRGGATHRASVPEAVTSAEERSSGEVSGSASPRKPKRSLVQPPGTRPFIVPDDTRFSKIAARCQTTVGVLRSLNGNVSDIVFKGQVLYVPEDCMKKLEFPGSLSDSLDSVSTGDNEGPGDGMLYPPDQGLGVKPEEGHSPRRSRQGSTASQQTRSSRAHSRSSSTHRTAAEQLELQNAALVPPEDDFFKRSITINARHITLRDGTIFGSFIFTSNSILFLPNASDPFVIENSNKNNSTHVPVRLIARLAIQEHAPTELQLRGESSSGCSGPVAELYRPSMSSVSGNSCPETPSENPSSPGFTDSGTFHPFAGEHTDCSSDVYSSVQSDKPESNVSSQFSSSVASNETSMNTDYTILVSSPADETVVLSDTLQAVQSKVVDEELQFGMEDESNTGISIKNETRLSGLENIPSCSDMNQLDERGCEVENGIPIKSDRKVGIGGGASFVRGCTPGTSIPAGCVMGVDMSSGLFYCSPSGLGSGVMDFATMATPPEVNELRAWRRRMTMDSWKERNEEGERNRFYSSVEEGGKGAEEEEEDFRFRRYSDSATRARKPGGKAEAKFKILQNGQTADNKHNLQAEEKSARGCSELIDTYNISCMMKPIEEIVPRRLRLPSTEKPYYLSVTVGTRIDTDKQYDKCDEIISTKLKSCYWFSIPRDSVGTLYQYIMREFPELYGLAGDVDPSLRGLAIRINVDEEEQQNMPDIFVVELDVDWPLPDLSAKSNILTDEHIKALSRSLPPILEGARWLLKYSSAQHGYSLLTLYDKLKDVDSYCLLVLKEKLGTICGAMLSCPIRTTTHFEGDGTSYVFSFKNGFQKYRYSAKNCYVMKGETSSVRIGDESGRPALYINDSLLYGRSCKCETFDSDRLTLDEDFVIINVEVWSFTHYV